MKKLDVIGDTYGELTVLEEHSSARNGQKRYKCQCSCGNTTNVLISHLRQLNTTSCGCKTPRGKDKKNWTGVGEISGAFWYDHVVRSANGDKGTRKELEFTLTKEEAWNLYTTQKGKCKLSGIDIKFPVKAADKTWTCSLDRIDSTKGYTLNNVQWVHKDINMMKRIYNNEYFINMCKEVAKNNGDGCIVV